MSNRKVTRGAIDAAGDREFAAQAPVDDDFARPARPAGSDGKIRPRCVQDIGGLEAIGVDPVSASRSAAQTAAVAMRAMSLGAPSASRRARARAGATPIAALANC